MPSALLTVVELPEFIAATRKLMDEDDRTLLIDHLAADPLAGDVIPGTGGVRKLRWALDGRGKRGGARVIYFHHDATLPLFLLTAFAKNDRSDLSQADRNGMKALTKLLVERYRAKGTRPMTAAAASIRRGLEQALAFAEGTHDPTAYRVHVPQAVDVRATREKLGLTQAQFAGRFGFSVNTLRHWEQGKRVPEGPARAYLLVIDRAPAAVEAALRVA